MGEYGKDDKVLESIPTQNASLRQKARFSETTGRNDNGPSRKAYWAEKFKLPLGAQNAAAVRIVPGEYLLVESDREGNLSKMVTPWKKVFEHSSGSGTAICSGGPFRLMESHRDMADECLGCEAYWQERWDRRNRGQDEWKDMKNRISPLFGFTVAVLGVVHKVPARYVQGPKAGSVKVDGRGEPVMEWVTCSRQGCEGCRTGAETQDGIKLPWAMRKTHFQTLIGWETTVGMDCTACGGDRTILTEKWVCRGCGNVIIDMSSTYLSSDEIEQVAFNLYSCPECSTQAFPNETLSCTQCDTPVRANLWNVDICVYGERPQGSNIISLQNSSISKPKPIDRKYAHLVLEPLDLDSLFAPADLEYQQRLWSSNKSMKEQANRMAREYGRA